MIATSAEHLALLRSPTRELWAVDLYEFRFVDGAVLRYSSHVLSTTWNGYTWAGGGPLFKRGETKIVRGLESDSLSIEISPRETDLLFDIPFAVAVRNGALDGVSVSLYRGHGAKPGAALAGAILRFKGEAANVEGDMPITLEVKSALIRLDAPIPRSVYEPGCDRTLFDAGCGAVRANFQYNGSLGQGSTRYAVVASLPHGNGYYSGGQIRFISGANAGAKRTIRRHADGDLLLSYPLVNSVGVGDQFQLWPGCAHDLEDCVNKFGNKPGFNGCPFVPAPETAL